MGGRAGLAWWFMLAGVLGLLPGCQPDEPPGAGLAPPTVDAPVGTAAPGADGGSPARAGARGLCERIVEALAAQATGATRFPCLVVGVIDGQHMVTSFQGSAAREHPRPPDEDTVFQLASISKVFGGVALAQMVEEGAVQLDESAGALLQVTLPVHPSAPQRVITLRDLITHSSGLAHDLPFSAAAGGWAFTPEEVVRALPGLSLAFVPGSASAYSNLGSGLVGHALALRTGLPSFDEVLVQKVTGPLAMPSTRSVPTAAMRARMVEGAADVWGVSQPNARIEVLDSAGAVCSSLRDLLTFARANLLPSGQVSIGPALERARTVHWSGGGGNIGLAWILGGPRAWHNGGLPGTSTRITLDVAMQRAVVVLANRAQEGVDALADTLLHAMGGCPVVLPLPLTGGAEDVREFTGSVDVELLAWRQGAIVRWTDDGTEPTAHSLAYAGPIRVDRDLTLCARTFVAGAPMGQPARASFRRLPLAAATPLAMSLPGLAFRLHEGQYFSLDQIPTEAAAAATGVAEQVTAIPAIRSRPGSGTEFTGYIDIPSDDIWRFDLQGNDGCRLWIDDMLVVDADGTWLRSGAACVGLRAGKHALRVLYSAIGADATLALMWSTRSRPAVEVPAASLSR